MKKMMLVGLLMVGTAMPAMAQVQVRAHTRSDGTYVPAHTRSAPDSSRTNNWSAQGNVNPYNGRQGTVDPYAPPRSSSIYQPYRPR